MKVKDYAAKKIQEARQAAGQPLGVGDLVEVEINTIQPGGSARLQVHTGILSVWDPPYARVGFDHTILGLRSEGRDGRSIWEGRSERVKPHGHYKTDTTR